MSNYALTPEVVAIGRLDFRGNVTPENWYQELRLDSDKAYLEAIVILTEIVYWYRPSETRDESTGQVIGLKKKFKSDKLQRNYQALANKFGLTKRQVANACHYLQGKGLIDLDFRTVVIGEVVASNVLFIGINPDRIEEITFVGLGDTYHLSKLEGSLSEVRAVALKGETNTKTTPEITSKITEKEEARDRKALSELEEKSIQDQPIADQSASLSKKQRDSANDGEISGETVFAAAPIFPPQKNNATANYEKRFASPHKYPELIEAGYSDIMIGTGYLDFDPIVVEAAVRHLKKHEKPCEVGDAKRFISNRIKQLDWAAIELLKESAATIANDRKKTEDAIAASTSSDEYYDTSRYYVPEPPQIDVEARRKAAESGIAKMKAARAEARKKRAS